MPTQSLLPNGEQPLRGGMLFIAALVLALANFIAVLDMTIANVSVATIAGALGVTSSQGTWVITSYAVAEAITVPLTGWLAGRYGAVRVFVSSMALFGISSMLCGLSNSLGVLVAGRVLQGLSGGPLMPLSQTLLLRIFPKDKAALATALWAMTTLVAPVLGPIVGGVICDQAHWSWIFFINVPIALICAWFAWGLLKRYESALEKTPIDTVGLGLLVIWVGALQIMLDEGKNLDWFSSPIIIALSIIAAIGFVAFMIWELTEEHPIVDLRVFRHAGYSTGVFTLVLAFGAFFGLNVLTPMWLQQYMGYTATWAGMTTAWSGVLAVLCAPFAAILSTKIDSRALVFAGVSWLAGVSLWRAFGTSDMTYWQIALPLLVMGVGLPFFFVPLTGQALGSVEERETASAAGLMNFLRTLAGAFATSLATASWEDRIQSNHADIVTAMNPLNQVDIVGMGNASLAQLSSLDQLATGQSVMLATNQIFMIIAVILFVAACSIWIGPRATRAVDASAAH
ncbi:DHA2 family efflux MFS transporter permease subunit [Uliginosibacterium sediminicola]|uniref:DHA2 family efflux MFS transporter permease subunit n=1 Tax=Uliginosibacterium sediminicola TaxID=2024550 RepID=A0ABU9Z3K2_9RHOO